ncbi:MAG: YfhO family protein, partial [Thermoanaerobaculia bacterium]
MNPTWLYVAIVYAIAVWIARRARIDLPWRVAAGFYLLVLLFFFRPMTGRYVSYPADVIRLITPWAEVMSPGRAPITKYDVSNSNTHDVTMQLVPWAHQVREAWRSLRLPLWNAEAGCGYPLLANGQSSALSPLRFIALPLPLGYAMTAEAALKLLIALTFMYLYCRRRYGEWASIAGSISFGFCTYLIAWLHFAHITAAVMLPAVLLAIDLLASGFTHARLVFASIAFALTAIAGHPETAIHMAFIALPFAVWVTFVEGDSVRVAARRFATIALAGIIAILLAAPFLFPFLEALQRSQRYQELKINPNRETPYSDFASAALLLQPSITGHLPEDRPWGPTTIESISGFTGIFAIVAAIAVALQIIVRRRWCDRELLFLALTLIALAAILNQHFVSVPLHALLGMVAHARLRFVLCALLSILSAAAIDARGRESGLFILIGAAVAAAMMLYVFRTLPFPSSGARDTALLAMLPSIVVLLATIFFALRGNVAVVILATIIELFVVDAVWNPSLPLRTSYPRTPLIAALERLRAAEPANSPFRIAGIGSALYPNTNVMFGFEDVRV